MKHLPSLRNNGLTLIEVLVSIAIMTMVGVVISSFQVDTFRFNRSFTSSLTTVDTAQRLLRPMTAEIRSASPSGLGAFPIATATTTTFAFYSDIDSDGLKELVQYNVSGTTMYKSVTKQTGTTPPRYDPANTVTTSFIEGVQNVTSGSSTFRYFSKEYIGAADGEILPSDNRTDDIRLVRIAIELLSDRSPITITSDVSIRNLKQQ